MGSISTATCDLHYFSCSLVQHLHGENTVFTLNYFSFFPFTLQIGHYIDFLKIKNIGKFYSVYIFFFWPEENQSDRIENNLRAVT